MVSLFFFTFFQGNDKTAPERTASDRWLTVDSLYSYRLFQPESGTWGYDIRKKDKQVIHQPAIPALPGNKGFARKEDARKVAFLVIGKMRKGESLPSVSREELHQLDIQALITN